MKNHYILFVLPKVNSNTWKNAWIHWKCTIHRYLRIFNIHRLERDAKLGALEERADALQDGCAQFEKQAAAMKNKFWLENLKSMIAMGVVGVIVLGLIYWKFFMAPPAPAYPYPPPGYAPPPPPPPSGGGGGDAGGGDAGGGDAGGGDAGDAGDGGGSGE